jgi:4-amino-4-deoxy-L-arabinose transferase-like glycosyltransferase
VRAAVGTRAHAARIEAVGLAALWLVALAIRLPYLWSAPSSPNELREIDHALATYATAAWHSPDPSTPYVGAVHDVVLGVAVGLFGPGPQVPRLVAAVLAAATVPLVYVLARELARPVGRRRLEDEFVGPRLAGLVAAGMLATSTAHVVVTSHAALAHNLAPFFVAAALFGLERALGTRKGRWLIPGGALLGLGLQTHPSLAALLPGAALVLWRAGRGLVLSGWGPAGLTAFFVGYATVLATLFHGEPFLGGPMPTETAGGSATSGDAEVRSPLGTYWQALSLELLALWRLLASQLGAHPPIDNALLDSLTWPYVSLALIGLAILVLRGRPLLPCAGLSFLLLLPAFALTDGSISGARVLMPSVIIGVAAMGVAIGTFAPLLARRGSLARLAVTLALLLLVLAPLTGVRAYYVEARDAGTPPGVSAGAIMPRR